VSFASRRASLRLGFVATDDFAGALDHDRLGEERVLAPSLPVTGGGAKRLEDAFEA
jgi:hypothetical protein